MPNTLTKSNTTTLVPAGEVTTEISVVSMPPGFVAPVDRPIVYVGGEKEGGECFYTWDKEESSRSYVPTNRFNATLLELKTVVRNPEDEMKRNVKLVAEFETATGQRIAICCGLTTYAGIGVLAGLNASTADELRGVIGLSGRVGRNGKVTFMAVFAGGALKRDQDAEALLKAAKLDRTLEEVAPAMIADINAKLQS